ncbi:hypothetical protein [Streptomyces nigra]|uniref:hypothetical protein n=1 Tax=Streptomyces nigra TaxID=1827580 RepID=UPI0036B51888
MRPEATLDIWGDDLMPLREGAALLIYITDARPEYIQNVLRTTALPAGAAVRYRYNKKWFNGDVWDQLVRSDLSGAKIIVAYMEGNRPGLASAKAIPIRFGTIISTHSAGKFGVLDVELDGFCGNSPLSDFTSADSYGFTDPGPRSGEFVRKVSLHRPTTDPDEVLSWQETAETLAGMQNLDASPFLFFQGLQEQGSGEFARLAKGKVALSNSRVYDMRVFGLWPKGSVGVQTFDVQADDSILKLKPATELRIGYKFDEFRVIVGATSPTSHGLDHLRVIPGPAWDFPALSIEVQVKRNPSYTLFKLGVPGVAAATAASASLLPEGSPLWLRISMVAVGSAGLGVATALKV